MYPRAYGAATTTGEQLNAIPVDDTRLGALSDVFGTEILALIQRLG